MILMVSDCSLETIPWIQQINHNSKQGLAEQRNPCIKSPVRALHNKNIPTFESILGDCRKGQWPETNFENEGAA